MIQEMTVLVIYGLPPVGFLQTKQLIGQVVFYFAKSKRRQLPPLACYWLRPCWKVRELIWSGEVTEFCRWSAKNDVYLPSCMTAVFVAVFRASILMAAD